MEEDTNPQTAAPLLIEEYRAMYQLVLYRLACLDRRTPFLGGGLAVIAAMAPVLPAVERLAISLAIPVICLWYVRSTINHARSFEDVLSRLREIELQLNEQAGIQAISFQSTHPSRGRTVGGRTGRETLSSVLWMTVFLVMAAWGGFTSIVGIWSIDSALFGVYGGFSIVYSRFLLDELARYRYRRQDD